MTTELLILIGCVGYLICTHMLNDSTHDQYHMLLVLSEFIVVCIAAVMIMSIILDL